MIRSGVCLDDVKYGMPMDSHEFLAWMEAILHKKAVYELLAVMYIDICGPLRQGYVYIDHPNPDLILRVQESGFVNSLCHEPHGAPADIRGTFYFFLVSRAEAVRDRLLADCVWYPDSDHLSLSWGIFAMKRIGAGFADIPWPNNPQLMISSWKDITLEHSSQGEFVQAYCDILVL